jgi:hypothetical protein
MLCCLHPPGNKPQRISRNCFQKIWDVTHHFKTAVLRKPCSFVKIHLHFRLRHRINLKSEKEVNVSRATYTTWKTTVSSLNVKVTLAPQWQMAGMDFHTHTHTHTNTHTHTHTHIYTPLEKATNTEVNDKQFRPNSEKQTSENLQRQIEMKWTFIFRYNQHTQPLLAHKIEFNE